MLQYLPEPLKNTFSFAGPAIIDQTIISGLNFAVAIYLARCIGLAAFGQFSLILIITFFCIELQRATIIAPFMNFFREQDKSDGYLSNVIYGQIVSASLTAIFIFVFFHFSTQLFPKWQINEFSALGALLIFFRLQQEFVRRLLFVEQKGQRALKMDCITAITIILGLVYLQFTGHLTVAYILILHILAYSWSLINLWPYLQKMSVGSTHVMLSRHWRYGCWLLAAVITTYASSNYLVLSGGAILGPQSIGLVKTAQYVMGGMIILFQAMENILPHHFAKIAHTSNRWELHQLFFKTLTAMLAFCTCYALLVLTCLPFIIRVLHLQNEALAGFMIKANILLAFILVTGYCLQYLLRALEKTKIIFLATFITSASSVIFSPWLIHNYGLKGIVYGLFLFQIVAQIVYAVFLLPFKKPTL